MEAPPFIMGGFVVGALPFALPLCFGFSGGKKERPQEQGERADESRDPMKKAPLQGLVETSG